MPVATGVRNTGFWLAGRSQRENATVIDTQVSADYFRSLNVAFLRGRAFQDGSTDAVVNEALANAYWPNADPVGKQFRLGFEGNPGPWLTVVGVTPNERVKLNAAPAAQVFYSCGLCGIVLVRTRGAAPGIGPIIRREVAGVDSSLVITMLQPLEQMAAQDSLIIDSRLRMALFAAFAVAGLLLACAGVYAVTSYSAAQRTREAGIRMALGATRGEIVRLMVGQSMVPVCAGIAAGVAGAFVLTRLLEAYLFGIAPRDLTVFIAAPAVLAAVAAIANLVPAMRGSRIDPMAALKYE
jgi:hypothetical protein